MLAQPFDISKYQGNRKCKDKSDIGNLSCNINNDCSSNTHVNVENLGCVYNSRTMIFWTPCDWSQTINFIP